MKLRFKKIKVGIFALSHVRKYITQTNYMKASSGEKK